MTKSSRNLSLRLRWPKLRKKLILKRIDFLFRKLPYFSRKTTIKLGSRSDNIYYITLGIVFILFLDLLYVLSKDQYDFMLIFVITILLSIWVINNGSKMAKSINRFDDVRLEDKTIATKEVLDFHRINFFWIPEMTWISSSLLVAIYQFVSSGSIARFFLEIIFCALIIMRWSIYYDISYPFDIPCKKAELA